MSPKTGSLAGIDVPQEILLKIEMHAYSNLEAEVGGMIFGRTGDTGKVVVTGFVPALAAEPQQMQLKFTHKVWDEILTQGNSLFPGDKIVGWYHTHPSFGIFLSDYDLFIQDNFFSGQGQFALVIDPIKGEMGWFRKNRAGIVKQFFSQHTNSGPKPRSIQKANSQSAPAVIHWVILATASLASLALGLGISYTVAPVDQSKYVRTLEKAVTQLRMQLDRRSGDFSIYYTMKSGDSVKTVMQRFYESKFDPELLLQWNPSISLAQMVPGTTIRLVNPSGLIVAPDEGVNQEESKSSTNPKP